MAGRIIDVTMQLIDKVTQPLKGVTASLADSNKEWQRAGKDITKTGQSITKVGQGLTTAITLPVVAAGTAAVNNFAEVDKAMTLIEGTMGKDKFAAADLGKAMEDAAATSVYSMSDAANAALSFARGGWDAAQAANAIAPAMNLAAGAGGDLDVVSAGLMATMNAFGAGAQEAESYADVFANACSNSALDVNSLSEAMSIAAPIFKTGGLDVQDAALAMGVMANNGTDANVAANALKSGLARLAAPAKEGSEWMKRLGITAFDSNGNMRSMIDIQNDLNAAFSTLSSREQEAAASAIFGKNQMASWLGLINTSPASVNELSDALGKQSTASEMAGAMMQGTGGSIESLKSSIDVLSYSFGQLIAQYATPVIQKITEIIDKFRNLDTGTKDMIVRFAGIAAAVGPALLVFGNLTMGIGAVVKKIGQMGTAIKAAHGVMAALTGPGAIVVAVLAAIGIAIALVVTHWDQVKAAALAFWDSVQPIVQHFQQKWEELGAAFKQIWTEQIQPAWENLSSRAQQVWTIIQPVLKRIGDFVKEVFERKFKAAIDIGCKVLRILGQVIGTVAAGAMNGLSSIIGIVIKVGGTISSIVTQIHAIIAEKFEACGAVFASFIERLSPIKDKWQELGDKVQEIWNTYIQPAIDAFKNAVSALWETVRPVLEKIGQFFMEIFQAKIKLAIDTGIEIFNFFHDSVATIIETLIGVINGIIDIIVGVFTGDWDKAWDGVKGVFSSAMDGIASIASSAVDTVCGILQGIADFVSGIIDSIKGIGSKAKEEADKVDDDTGGNAVGTSFWRGGRTKVHERGAEIIDLPRGTRIYPHSESLKMAYNEGRVQGGGKGGSINITIPKLADNITVRSSADIEAIAAALANKLEQTAQNIGGGELGYIY